jgi:hypothetical protein
VGFVYRVRDKEKNRVFIGYRTSIPFSRLRGQIMSEMSNEDYGSKLSNRIFDEEWKLFNFDYELVFESDDVEKLKLVKSQLIRGSLAQYEEFGYNLPTIDYRDWPKVVATYKKNKYHLTKTAKELNMDFRTVKRILEYENVKLYKTGEKSRQPLTLLHNESGKSNSFSTRSAAIDWLIKKGYAGSTNKKHVHTILKRVIKGERKSAYGFTVIDGRFGVVYMITHLDSGLKYIGIRKHKASEILNELFNRSNYKKNSALLNVIKSTRYNRKKFSFEIIGYYKDKEQGEKLRRELILEHGTNRPEFGLNITEKTRVKHIIYSGQK